MNYGQVIVPVLSKSPPVDIQYVYVPVEPTGVDTFPAIYTPWPNAAPEVFELKTRIAPVFKLYKPVVSFE